MSTQGPNYCATGANDNVAGAIDWSNPTNIQGVVDTTNASAVLTAGGVTSWLRGTNFSFTIPGGATINGITVEWNGYRDNIFAAVTFNASKLYIGGSYQGSTGALPSLGTSPAWIQFGHSATTWGLSVGPSDINDVNFGAAVRIASSDALSAYFDSVRITIDYTSTSGISVTQVRMAEVRPDFRAIYKYATHIRPSIYGPNDQGYIPKVIKSGREKHWSETEE